ncbi:MAG TPA: acyl carrier protein [Acidimicrobiales bacterium]|nr:acyl carrier protein [Acidimicrobiales bacterium]
MERAIVLEQLIEVAVDVLGVDPTIVSETSSFKDDLDADSLDLVEVVMALEERFDISVPEDKLDGITTVGEAVDLVMGIAAGAAPDSDASDPATSGDTTSGDAASGDGDAPAAAAAGNGTADRAETAESADRV